MVLCRKAKPLMVMLLELARTKLRSPRSTAPPRVLETMVICAALVPFLPDTLIAPPDGTVYVPSATMIRSPGTAALIALWSSARELTGLSAAEASIDIEVLSGTAASAATAVPLRNVRRCMVPPVATRS